jgi:hypothetical protein
MASRSCLSLSTTSREARMLFHSCGWFACIGSIQLVATTCAHSIHSAPLSSHSTLLHRATLCPSSIICYDITRNSRTAIGISAALLALGKQMVEYPRRGYCFSPAASGSRRRPVGLGWLMTPRAAAPLTATRRDAVQHRQVDPRQQHARLMPSRSYPGFPGWIGVQPAPAPILDGGPRCYPGSGSRILTDATGERRIR